MNTNNKSDNEIRLEIITMALKHADDQYNFTVDKVRETAGFNKETSCSNDYILPEDNRLKTALRAAKKIEAYVLGSNKTE